MTATGDLVFVYGTLRSGQTNHRRLLAGKTMVPALLEGHELRLGDWPFVLPAPGSTVVGEVVEVDPPVLAELDLLEDVAGGWYRRERCPMRLQAGGHGADGGVGGHGGGGEEEAWVYTGGTIAASGGRRVPGGDWLGGFAWYVGYGSNLSAARFGRYLAQCRDTTEPWRWAAVEVPHRLVFARESSRWGGGGVAFLDPATDPKASTLGRAWLLTWQQFADVLAQECGLPVGSVEVPLLGAGSVVAHVGHWYGCVVPLGSRDGWPMVTFTDETAGGLTLATPGPSYRAVVAEGLAETHGLSPDEAEAYIRRHSL